MCVCVGPVPPRHLVDVLDWFDFRAARWIERVRAHMTCDENTYVHVEFGLLFDGSLNEIVRHMRECLRDLTIKAQNVLYARLCWKI